MVLSIYLGLAINFIYIFIDNIVLFFLIIIVFNKKYKLMEAVKFIAFLSVISIIIDISLDLIFLKRLNFNFLNNEIKLTVALMRELLYLFLIFMCLKYIFKFKNSLSVKICIIYFSSFIIYNVISHPFINLLSLPIIKIPDAMTTNIFSYSIEDVFLRHPIIYFDLSNYYDISFALFRQWSFRLLYSTIAVLILLFIFIKKNVIHLKSRNTKIYSYFLLFSYIDIFFFVAIVVANIFFIFYQIYNNSFVGTDVLKQMLIYDIYLFAYLIFNSFFLKYKIDNFFGLADTNQQLVLSNDQLRKNLEVIGELAVAKERNRFARDAHDTLGHTFVSLKLLLETILSDLPKDNNHTREGLKEALKITEEGLKEIRNTIKGLTTDDSRDIKEVLQNLFSKYNNLGIDIDFCPNVICEKLEEKYISSIYKICQEAITNSVKHGKSRNIHVLLNVLNEGIKLYISDDGTGCKEIKKGMGLNSIEARVSALKGDVNYWSDGEYGFNISIGIPVKSVV